jgi:hypothetical protein
MFVVAGTNAKFTTLTLAVAPMPQSGTARHNKVIVQTVKKSLDENFMFVINLGGMKTGLVPKKIPDEGPENRTAFLSGNKKEPERFPVPALIFGQPW